MSFFQNLLSACRLSEQSKKERLLNRKNEAFREEIYQLSQKIAVYTLDQASLMSEISDLTAQLETDKAAFLSQISSLEITFDRERESIRALQQQNEELQLDLAKANAQITLKDYEKELLASLHTLHKERVNEAIASTVVGYAHTPIRPEISPELIPPTR